MIKMSKRDAKLLLYTVGILVLLLVYVFVYQPTKAENEALEAENAELRTELAAREEHAQKKEEYSRQTEEMAAEIADTLAIFPEAVKEEDTILYADELEKTSNMQIASISIGALNQLWELGTEKYLYGSLVNYTFTVSYDDMKKVVKAVQNHDDKRNVENIVLSFDAASGNVLGSMNLNFYSMTGTSREYQAPQIPGISHGTKNIFGAAVER